MVLGKWPKSSESEVIVFSGPDAPPQVCNVYREYEMCSQWEVRVRVMRSSAHPQGVFVYRIEMGGGKLVFATDVEGYAGGDRQLIQFARGADLLIHDAEFTSEEYVKSRPVIRAALLLPLLHHYDGTGGTGYCGSRSDQSMGWRVIAAISSVEAAKILTMSSSSRRTMSRLSRIRPNPRSTAMPP